MKRLSLEIWWSEDDQAYLARCPQITGKVNMGGAIAHGDSWEEAAREARDATENVLTVLDDENARQVFNEVRASLGMPLYKEGELISELLRSKDSVM
jgi:predicted RNase H-like HicB family nuclease